MRMKFIVPAIIALGTVVAVPLAAPAATAETEDPCATAVYSERQARKIVRGHLRELGYRSSTSGRHRVLPPTYRIKDVTCRDGKWRVAVVLRESRSEPLSQDVVLVNCHTGAVEQS